jgi:hypothetical protein
LNCFLPNRKSPRLHAEIYNHYFLSNPYSIVNEQNPALRLKPPHNGKTNPPCGNPFAGSPDLRPDDAVNLG